MRNKSIEDELQKFLEARNALAEQRQIERQRQAAMKEDIDLMEGFYQASIKQAEKILNSVQIGEIIHVDEYGKRLFAIIEKSGSMSVKVKDVKTGQVLPIYANQILKIEQKPEMLDILYKNDKKS